MCLPALVALIMGVFCGLQSTPLDAQTSGKSISDRTFDFWVGRWNTEMTSSLKSNVTKGTDTVNKHLGGRLLEEIFQKGSQGENFGASGICVG